MEDCADPQECTRAGTQEAFQNPPGVIIWEPGTILGEITFMLTETGRPEFIVRLNRGFLETHCGHYVSGTLANMISSAHTLLVETGVYVDVTAIEPFEDTVEKRHNNAIACAWADRIEQGFETPDEAIATAEEFIKRFKEERS